MKYKALKEVTFSGVTYPKGAEIPDGVVQEEAARRLLRTFYIEKLGDNGGGGSAPELSSAEGVNF